jgi:formate dehydrogenase major subunit
MVTLTIDGQLLQAESGQTVLDVARAAGIFIPTLCDHPALRPSGGCRLCMVEVQGARGPQAACTLPASDGMVIATDTPALCASRQFVLSMLFSESSHICAFCPVSGTDCELQQAAYGVGMNHWPYPPKWQPRALDISSHDLAFDPNRCILCRRCVRACAELVGNATLGLEGRGSLTRLVADCALPLGQSTCVGCGTCVQVCPTGALFDRRSAYQGQRALTNSVASVCLGCSVGCGLQVITRDGRLVRLDGDWASPVNGGVLCRLGRYAPLEETRPRLRQPLVRSGGRLQPATWDEALHHASVGLTAASGLVAGLISPRLPVEALATFRQLFADGLHSDQLSTLELGSAARVPVACDRQADLAALRQADLVILVGADVAQYHQVLGFQIQRRLPDGLQLVVIDAHPTELDHRAALVLRPAAGAEARLLAAWLAAASPNAQPGAVAALVAEAGVTAEAVAELAQRVAGAQRPVIVYGAALTGTQPEAVQLLADLVSALACLRLLGAVGGANGRAASRLKLNQPCDLAGVRAAYVALGDDALEPALLAALGPVPFVVVQASCESELTERADVVLPVENWTEQAGHFLNLEGRLQTAQRALAAPAGVRSNVSVLASLAERLGLPVEVDWRAAIGAGAAFASNPN